MILPKILDFPKKLLKIVKDFNKYRIFLLEGGRGSGKSHSAARFILYLGEQRKLRVICGRETQNSIEESVYQLLVDIIQEFELNYDISKSQITHRTTGTTIRFKGFREQGIVNIKSLEGCDLLWVEEAQTVTQLTLDTIIPTIRKNNAKIIFTMNRFIRTDPVYTYCTSRDFALCIHIDYHENEYCPENLIVEANECKAEDLQSYNHIWLGQPRKSTEEYVFDFDRLADLGFIEPFGEIYKPQSILSIDFASGGGDLCVASHLKRMTNTQWDLASQVEWDEFDTDISVGKSIDLYGQLQPDVFITDASGLGYPMFMSISKVVPTVIGFDGGSTDKVTNRAANNRAEMYLTFSDWVNKRWLQCKSKKTVKEMETVKKEYRADGSIVIEAKKKARKRGVKSQDHADSVGMAIFAAKHYLGKVEYTDVPIGARVKRVNKRRG